MKKILVFCLVMLAMTFGCNTRQKEDGKPVVTVTILPMQFFVDQLAGGHFRVNVLVPPGASHHNYDPTPRQLRDLEKSGALFVNGHLGFEKSWIPRIQSNYRDLPMIDLSAGMNLITEEGGEGTVAEEDGHQHDGEDHHHEGVDPHYWMSVVDARQMAANMAAGLILADPSCRQMIGENLTKLNIRLDSLASALDEKLSSLTHRSFLIFHPALAYLARDYHLTQHSMELAGKEPTAAHFKKLVDIAAMEKINTIFVQKEYDQENARTLAREIGAIILTIDPMSPDWLGEMKELAEKIGGMDGR